MKMRRMVIGVVVLAVVLGMIGCYRDDASGDPSEVVLRTYDLPEGVNRTNVMNLLGTTFKTGETSVAGTAYGPGNSVIVTGPRSVHDGVAAIIAEYTTAMEAEAQAPPPTSVAVDYWVVIGQPGNPAPRPATLSAIAPALDEIESQQGQTGFHLLERIRLTGVEGKDSTLRGRLVSAQQRIMTHPSAGRLADIELAMHTSKGIRYHLKSRIELQPGRFVVLGQTAYDRRGQGVPRAMESGAELLLYYVIVAD